MELTWHALAILAVVALAAGFLDTLAGGGGLLTLPALLLAGVPPLAALGTNKLQGSFGTGMATYQVLRRRRVSWADVRWPMLLAFVGSVAGSMGIQFVDADGLRILIPVVLALIAAYFLLVPRAHHPPAQPRMGEGAFRGAVVPAIGAYDGAFGPGTGSLFALTGVALRAQTLVQSTAVAKTLNFATNVASLAVFLAVGQVVLVAGAAMIGGQLVGSYVASHVLFRVKPLVLRVLIVVMSLGMLVRVLMD
ncbi:TSUP family transporter [Demequina sp.]|uniref:TSUP family transporter n=1 Tax=Demequina sp. TaxID=2050685 RepID=UPI0025B97645|nr:TSUP family transporter [Demequina sp.]